MLMCFYLLFAFLSDVYAKIIEMNVVTVMAIFDIQASKMEELVKQIEQIINEKTI